MRTGSIASFAMDREVEEFSGKKKVDQMKAMERNIGEIQNQQSDRLKQRDDTDNDG